MGRTPKSISEIYEDFQRRRDALITALTDGTYVLYDENAMFTVKIVPTLPVF